MDISGRLSEFIKSQHISVLAFEKRCGLSQGYVKNISKTIGQEKLEAILKQFPNLNRDWLVYGEGEMLQPSYNTATVHGDSSVAAINSNVTLADNAILAERVKHLEELLAEKERLIKVLLEARGK